MVGADGTGRVATIEGDTAGIEDKLEVATVVLHVRRGEAAPVATEPAAARVVYEAVDAEASCVGFGVGAIVVTAGSTRRCCMDCVLPEDDYCCCCTSAQALLAPCGCSHIYCSQCSDPYC
jgi:hypothetical protein